MMVRMADLERRSPSRLSRRQREQRAYRLTLATGGLSVIAVVGIVLAIAGVIGGFVPSSPWCSQSSAGCCCGARSAGAERLAGLVAAAQIADDERDHPGEREAHAPSPQPPATPENQCARR